MTPTVGTPRVTIGLPVRNGERFLESAIASLLAQSFQDFEIVASDNASEDRTPEILRRTAEREARFRWHRFAANRGTTANFQYVLDEARGDCFAWAADHDLWDRRFLERAVEVLDADPRVALCFFDTVEIDVTGKEATVLAGGIDTRGRPPAERFRRYLAAPNFNAFYGVFRTGPLRATGPIGSHYGSDAALLARLSLLGDFAWVPEPLFLRRQVHPDEAGPVQWDRKIERQTLAAHPRNVRRRFNAGMSAALLGLIRAAARAPLTLRQRGGLALSVAYCFATKYRPRMIHEGRRLARAYFGPLGERLVDEAVAAGRSLRGLTR